MISPQQSIPKLCLRLPPYQIIKSNMAEYYSSEGGMTGSRICEECSLSW